MDKEIFVRAQNGDKAAMEQLVTQNSGLVWSIVSRFLGRGTEADDLFQIGSIGLIKAISRFDTDMGYQFSTYAVPLIMGEIRRFLRDDGMIKVSRSTRELAGKAGAASRRLQNIFGREPTVSELAEDMKVSKEELAAAFEAMAPYESIYQTTGGDDASQLLVDKLADAGGGEQTIVNKVTVHELIRDVPEREKKIIYYRYFKDKTQSETAELVGISQVQVSRLEKKILLSLRQKLEQA